MLLWSFHIHNDQNDQIILSVMCCAGLYVCVCMCVKLSVQDGFTALLQACTSGHWHLAHILMDTGADVRTCAPVSDPVYPILHLYL